MEAKKAHTPLVSVITIFLNEERFLEEAIESVFAQTYPHWELLLCDDGSTDGSTHIARKYAERFPEQVRYLEHEGHQNRGMSATRNLGLCHAQGTYIAWLDGDDVWSRNKLERQVELMEAHPEAAMVYGPLHIWYSWTGEAEDRRRDTIQELGGAADTLIQPPHLLTRFLRNDQHTPGGELVRRGVLEEVEGFENTFRNMHEDGIVHAKICLEWPVYAASECWYRYRQHPDSCCNQSIAAGTDQAALRAYLAWLAGYLKEKDRADSEVGDLVQRLLRRHRDSRSRLMKEKLKTIAQQSLRQARVVADRFAPAFLRRWVGLVGFGKRGRPPVGWLHFGNLRRLTPLSRHFGFDRGSPVDRYYIERFLKEHAVDIHGYVLEVGDREYTLHYGGDRVTHSDVLHARLGNPQATLVGDLCTGENIPQDTYDCIILTQVLPFLWDFEAAIATARGALRPGGVLLATVPGISQISRFDANQWGDFWRFTSLSAKRLFEEAFGAACVDITVDGNVLAATAFLHGVAAQELRPEELNYRDPDYEMIIAIRATKAAEESLL